MGKGFGSVNLDAKKFDGPKYWKLRQPDATKGEEIVELILRLLPSMHSYEETGEWKFYYGQHFGHAGVNAKNPEKPRARPFGCIKKMGKNKVVEVACPKCEQIDKQMAKKERLENELAAKLGIEDKKSQEFYEAKQGDAKLKAVGDWLQRHNNDKKYWINAMNDKGEFGILQVPYTFVKDKLDPLLRELRDKRGMDVFNPAKGAYLRFTSTGKRPRVTQSVELYQELVTLPDGEEVSKTKTAPMTDAQIEQALKICPDLSKDVVKFISAEQIQQLIDCDDSPEAVDRIWGGPVEAKKPTTFKKTEAPADDENAGPEDDIEEDLKAFSGKTETKETKTEKVEAPADEDDEEAELERRLAEKRAKKAAAAASTKAPAKETQVSSAEDFVSQFDAK